MCLEKLLINVIQILEQEFAAEHCHPELCHSTNFSMGSMSGGQKSQDNVGSHTEQDCANLEVNIYMT